jgi:PST family polysaccharide transporter
MNHSVVRNASALYATQMLGLVLPLLTVPYLSRVLNAAGWGDVLVAQAFAIWASLPIEYGFGLSASRWVARHRSDPERLEQIVSEVWGAKAVLLVPVLICAAIAAATVPVFRAHPAFLGWALVQSVAMGFSPFWYFQGTERMGRAVVVEVAARAFSTAGILLLVTSPRDGWKVVALQALAGVVSTAVPAAWIFREVRWQRPSWSRSVAALKEGLGVFVFRAASTVTASAQSFVLGLFAAPVVVGYYGGGERIASALVVVTGPLSQALYPHMSHLVSSDQRRAARLARLSLLVVGGAATLAMVVTLALAPQLVRGILGAGYEPSISVLRVLSLLLPLRAATSVLGMQWLLPSGHEGVVSRIVILTGALNLALAILAAPRWLQDGMAWAVVTSELCAMVGLAYASARRGIADGFALRT